MPMTSKFGRIVRSIGFLKFFFISSYIYKNSVVLFISLSLSLIEELQIMQTLLSMVSCELGTCE